MLNLDTVTLCAIDCIQMPLSARALQISMARCRFADTVLFSHVQVGGPFRTGKIDRIESNEGYSAFVLKHLSSLVETPFVLMIQWDGYILDPGAWTPEFFDFDYIGAKWPWFSDAYSVGNGGFSLRSRKLLRAMSDPRIVVQAGIPEDNVICRENRPFLEREFGIRFAPEAVAQRFSYETLTPNAPTFGFHGLGNLYRHVDDTEMLLVAKHLVFPGFNVASYVHLMIQYFHLRKFPQLLALYSRFREIETAESVFNMLLNASSANTSIAGTVIELCEGMLHRARSSGQSDSAHAGSAVVGRC